MAQTPVPWRPVIVGALTLALGACRSTPEADVFRATWLCSVPLDRSLGWGGGELAVDDQGRLLGRRLYWIPATSPESPARTEFSFGDEMSWAPPALRQVRASMSTSRAVAAAADLVLELSDGGRAQAEFYRPPRGRDAARAPTALSSGAGFTDPAFLERLAQASWVRVSVVELGSGRVLDTAVVDLARQAEATERIRADWPELERRARDFRSQCQVISDFDAIL